MKILTRYVIKEAVSPFLVGVFFFTFGFIMELLPRVINMIVNKGAPLKLSLEIFLYMLPFNMAITIPMAVLMSSIISYGRLSGDNEIVAMKALAFPVMRIYKPIIIFGVLTFLFSLFFNNVIMPETNYRYRALTIYIVNTKPSMTVDAMKFLKIPDSQQYIGAQDVSGDKLKNVLLYDVGGDANGNYTIITAKEGKWIDNDVNSYLIKLRLNDGLIQELNKNENITNTFTRFDNLDINIKRTVQANVGGHDRGLREMPFWKIQEYIENYEIDRSIANTKGTNDIIKNEYQVGVYDNLIEDIEYDYFRTGLIETVEITDKESGSIRNLNFDEFKNKVLKEKKKLLKEKIDKNKTIVPAYYYIEFQKCFSIPAACLFVVLIGAPLGMVSKRSGKGGGFGLSLIIIAIYYGLLIGAETIGRTGMVPPGFAMWIPNVVLFIMGMFLILKSILKYGQ